MTSTADTNRLKAMLDFQGKSPKLYDRAVCAQALAAEGIGTPPASYVDYFSIIGFVGWKCDGDGMGLFPPEATSQGINEWNAKFRGWIANYEFPLTNPHRFTMIGTVDDGGSICWDKSRGGAEPVVVRITGAGKVLDCGTSIADFLLKYWLTGICVSSKNHSA